MLSKGGTKKIQTCVMLFLLLASAATAFSQTAKAPKPAKTRLPLSVSPTPTPSPTAVVLASLSSSEPKSAPAAAESSFISEELIHFGDLIDVDILGSLEYDWRGNLDSQGFLPDLPYTEAPIFALCRTETELANDIAETYKKVLRNPEVVVRVVDRTSRQPATLFGAVRTPMRLRIQRPVSLTEIIALAGGFTERASGEITVFRPANISCTEQKAVHNESTKTIINISDLIAGKPEANLLVRTGDIVTVEEAKPIFVTGGVVAPQPILFRKEMTLSRALAIAGGLSRDADAANIIVFRRTSDGSLKIIEADYEKIKKQVGQDVPLEAFDIIEVAQSGKPNKEKRPPTLTGWETSEQKLSNLPLRVIN